VVKLSLRSYGTYVRKVILAVEEFLFAYTTTILTVEMPSKRKVELSPEPTPQTRRRSAKPATTTASASKRPRESVVATEERIRRTRRDEMAPSLDSQSSSVPSTNRARRVIHKEIIETDEVVVIHYEPPTGSKKGGESTAVVSSKTPIKAPSNPKSALKSANR